MTNREVIRSKDNSRLSYARSVRNGKVSDAIFIEGKRLCLEAVRSNVDIELCLVSESYSDIETIDLLGRTSKLCVFVAERIFDSLAETKSPQGVVIIAKRPTDGRARLAEAIRQSLVPTIVFLDEVNNPSNLGAILRTVEAAGAAGVITSIGSADALSPKANRAALGANLRTPIWEKADSVDAISFAQENGLTCVATDVSGSVDYLSLDWTRPTLLMLGSEASGLNSELANAADATVTIPLANRVESLNLAVSAGILLFEAARQNRMK